MYRIECLLTSERSEEVPFLRWVRRGKRTVGSPPFGNSAPRKWRKELSQSDETRTEGPSGQNAGTAMTGIKIARTQHAQSRVKRAKMAVFAISSFPLHF